MKKTVLVFGALIIALLALFQLSKYSFIVGNLTIEMLIGFVAVLSFFVGIFINKRNSKSIEITSEEIDKKKIEELQISKREYEVLQLIKKGLSNKEIAETLFLSESTIKTHVSNLLIKLDAKRRTQALQKAKELKII